MRRTVTIGSGCLILGACQLVGGIETRNEYVVRPGSSGNGGMAATMGSAAGRAGGVLDGGTLGDAGTREDAGASDAGSSGADRGGSAAGGGAGRKGSGNHGGTSATGEAGAESAGAGEGGQSTTASSVCGDGVLQRGELCDTGSDNGRSGGCDTECQFACTGACPLRVDPTLPSSGDGKHWSTAFKSIGEAVNAQQNAGGGEVWVKRAVVKATASGELLTMKSSVAIYGGFVGTETTRTARPAPSKANATVLDANAVAYPLVRGAGGARLDGFLLRNGSGAGGAALSVGVVTDLVIHDVWFEDNVATGSACGGALLLSGGAMRVEGGAFEGNTSSANGGAACLEGSSSLTVDGTSFLNNQAVTSGAGVAAIGSYSPDTQPSLTLTNATFIGNAITDDTPSGKGGAVYVTKADLSVADSDFAANVVPLGPGAGVYCDWDSPCTIENSTFAQNLGFEATVSGNSSNLRIVNATFAFNDANCPGKCEVDSDGGATLVQNSIVATSTKTQTPSMGDGASGANNCVLFLSGGLGQQASPFDADLVDRDGNGVPEYLLVQPAVNPCLDAGSATFADEVGIPWATLTTSGDSCLDAAPLDAGRHYQPTVASPVACQ